MAAIGRHGESNPAAEERASPRKARDRTALAILAVERATGPSWSPNDAAASLRRAVETALRTSAQPLIAVIGANPEAAVEHLAGLPVILAMNRDWAEGLNSYVRSAVLTTVADPQIAALAVWRSDQPLVTDDDLAKLMQTREAENVPLVAASLDGHLDLPAVFRRDYFRELNALGARDMLTDWLNLRREFVRRVEMPQAFGTGVNQSEAAIK